MRLMNMTPSKIADYFKKSDLVLFSTGSLEIHGSHNPVGADTIIPEKILELIEKKTEVLVAPTMPYGSADAQLGFPGSISLGPKVTYLVVNKVVESLYMMGARRIIFINGHGGNISSLERVGLEWHKKGLLSANVSWWTLLAEMDTKYKAGHGCKIETSAVMFSNPSLVDLSNVKDMSLKNDLSDEIPSHYIRSIKFKGVEVDVNRPVKSVSDNGWFGRVPELHPKNASVELGEEMLTKLCDYLVDFIDAFKRAKLPSVS